MDIPALSMTLSSMELSGNIGVAMLAKSLDSVEALGTGMEKMMEASVTPHLGQNIDYRV